ncbi:proteasome subunit beta type-2-B-like [Bidens hawaiensis]|uniref:proteasome subunit beta type-2-B-like n=1 Tax=Bidens hawaiensis TaxID=980011 RepID=UPI00404B3D4F
MGYQPGTIDVNLYFDNEVWRVNGGRGDEVAKSHVLRHVLLKLDRPAGPVRSGFGSLTGPVLRSSLALRESASPNWFDRKTGEPNPYMESIVLAGHDKETGPSLYFIDYIATLHKSNMTVDEAIKLAGQCIEEMRYPLVVAPQNMVMKIVDKGGHMNTL